MLDTIAAIATPLAAGGIGIVRISGAGAFAAADAVFSPVSGGPLSGRRGYTAAFGHVHESARASAGGEADIDECVALIFRAPRSYTGEDVAELSCHGGVSVMKRVLRAVLNAGARLAEPGEFTKRAFLNGKLDLTRAEAVMELIGAQGDFAARAAAAQQEGALFRSVTAVKETLVDLSADLAAWADFPEDDIPGAEPEEIGRRLTEALGRLRRLLETGDAGRVLREGVDTVIAGRPNAGKSTLMNRLARCERSIVTEIPGTTRDIVEETVRCGGVQLRVSDTAGLRETADPVEKIGVARALGKIRTAQLILAVFDGSQQLDEEDRKLLALAEGRRAVAVVNKVDLPQVFDMAEVTGKIPRAVCLSAASGQGLDMLERAVGELFGTTALDPDGGILYNERQRQAVQLAADCLAESLAALRDGMTLDAVSAGIDRALSALMELTGENVSEAVIGQVFSKFCIGK
jgi:tRNA modification GTPase